MWREVVMMITIDTGMWRWCRSASASTRMHPKNVPLNKVLPTAKPDWQTPSAMCGWPHLRPRRSPTVRPPPPPTRSAIAIVSCFLAEQSPWLLCSSDCITAAGERALSPGPHTPSTMNSSTLAAGAPRVDSR